MKRKISYKNVLLAFVLASLVFLLGILVGGYIANKQYESIDGFISDLRLQTMSLESQFNLVAGDPCKAMNTSYLGEELSVLNNRLDHLEGIYGTDDASIIQMKRYYSLLQIRHWLFFREARKVCNESVELVLFFYSNERCESCETQGSVLTSFRRKYPLDVKVYSFDINIDDPALNTLKEIYNIEKAPTIIYNEEVFEGFIEFNELECIRDEACSISERNISEDAAEKPED
jgi:hypothetical protein